MTQGHYDFWRTRGNGSPAPVVRYHVAGSPKATPPAITILGGHGITASQDRALAEPISSVMLAAGIHAKCSDAN